MCHLLPWNIYFELFCKSSKADRFSFSLHFSLVAFCTQQNTVGHYCEGVICCCCSNKAKTKQIEIKRRHKRVCRFQRKSLTETRAAVVLLTTAAKTTDCCFLPRKVENTSTLIFNLHHRKRKYLLLLCAIFRVSLSTCVFFAFTQ